MHAELTEALLGPALWGVITPGRWGGGLSGERGGSVLEPGASRKFISAISL